MCVYAYHAAEGILWSPLHKPVSIWGYVFRLWWDASKPDSSPASSSDHRDPVTFDLSWIEPKLQAPGIHESHRMQRMDWGTISSKMD